MKNKRIKSTLARILNQAESILDIYFDQCEPNQIYSFKGSQLQILRNEILNALNDLGRAGADNDEEDMSIKLYPGMIDAVRDAEFNPQKVILKTPNWIDALRLHNILKSSLVYLNKHWIIEVQSYCFNEFISFIELSNLGKLPGYLDWKKKVIGETNV